MPAVGAHENRFGDVTAQLVAQDPALTQAPDAIEITLEPASGSQSPGGQVVLMWSN